jgi:hypothetical protein
VTPILDRIRAHGGEVIRDRWTLRLRRGRLTDAAIAWLREPRNRDALAREVWPEYDDWEERAAIREYDGGQPRDEAEEAAYREVMRC